MDKLKSYLSAFRADMLVMCSLAASTTLVNSLPLGLACLIALFSVGHVWFSQHPGTIPHMKSAAGAVICCQMSGALLTIALGLRLADALLLGLFAIGFFVKSAEHASKHTSKVLSGTLETQPQQSFESQ